MSQTSVQKLRISGLKLRISLLFPCVTARAWKNWRQLFDKSRPAMRLASFSLTICQDHRQKSPLLPTIVQIETPLTPLFTTTTLSKIRRTAAAALSSACYSITPLTRFDVLHSIGRISAARTKNSTRPAVVIDAAAADIRAVSSKTTINSVVRPSR